MQDDYMDNFEIALDGWTRDEVLDLMESLGFDSTSSYNPYTRIIVTASYAALRRKLDDLGLVDLSID